MMKRLRRTETLMVVEKLRSAVREAGGQRGVWTKGGKQKSVCRTPKGGQDTAAFLFLSGKEETVNVLQKCMYVVVFAQRSEAGQSGKGSLNGVHGGIGRKDTERKIFLVRSEVKVSH
mmetsp:Transcript_29658/g.58218  ORF Transcript_29658/g.58218 Transcript_29658/m.58218 type:complete len:117 (-) Transcript_29658:467-817(-)